MSVDLLLVAKVVPFDWAVFWTAVAAIAGGLGFIAGLIGLVLSITAGRRADEASTIANIARTSSAEEAKRAADALQEANTLFAQSTAPSPWSVQFTDRVYFNLVNMSGSAAENVVATQAGDQNAGGFGMVLDQNGNRAEPGRAIQFAWHSDTSPLSPVVLPVLLKWESGPERSPMSMILHIDRRPDAIAIERLDSALADVMAALLRRHQDLQVWISTTKAVATPEIGHSNLTHVLPQDRPWGPTDADLQTYVDIAMMRSSADVTTAMDALANTTFAIKQGRTGWQSRIVGEIAGDIRKWRTHEWSQDEFVEELRKLDENARAQLVEFQKRFPQFQS